MKVPDVQWPNAACSASITVEPGYACGCGPFRRRRTQTQYHLLQADEGGTNAEVRSPGKRFSAAACGTS